MENLEENMPQVSDRFTDELPTQAALRVLLHSSRLMLKKNRFGDQGLNQLPNPEKIKGINRWLTVSIIRILLSNGRLKYKLISVIVPVLLKELEKEKL